MRRTKTPKDEDDNTPIEVCDSELPEWIMGEHRLLVEMIRMSIRDLKSDEEEVVLDAKDWLTQEEYKKEWSFYWVCEVLNIERSGILRELKRKELIAYG